MQPFPGAPCSRIPTCEEDERLENGECVKICEEDEIYDPETGECNRKWFWAVAIAVLHSHVKQEMQIVIIADIWKCSCLGSTFQRCNYAQTWSSSLGNLACNSFMSGCTFCFLGKHFLSLFEFHCHQGFILRMEENPPPLVYNIFISILSPLWKILYTGFMQKFWVGERSLVRASCMTHVFATSCEEPVIPPKMPSG